MNISSGVGRYSRPPNIADLGTDEKEAVFGNRRYWESYITYKTFIWDLEIGGGIGGMTVPQLNMTMPGHEQYGIPGAALSCLRLLQVRGPQLRALLYSRIIIHFRSLS